MNRSEIPLSGETDKGVNIKIAIQGIVHKSREWLWYIASKWIIILIGLLIGAAFGFYGEHEKKILFVAKLTYVTEGAKSVRGEPGSLASLLGSDNGGGSDAFSGDNLFELMQTKAMIQKALLSEVEIKGKKQSLLEFYIGFNKLREKWDKNPTLKNIQFLPGADPLQFSIVQNSLMNEFHAALTKSNRLSMARQKNSSFTTINVIAENEFFAKTFLEALIKVVSEFYVQTKTKKAMEDFRILQHQTDSMKVVLNEAISGVAVSTDRNPNPNLSRQVLKVPSQRRQIDVQSTQALFMQMTQNLESAKISLRKETPLLEIIDKPVFPLQSDVLNIKGAMLFGAIVGAIIAIGFLVIRKLYLQVMIG